MPSSPPSLGLSSEWGILLDEHADISGSSEDSDMSLGAPLSRNLDGFGGAKDLNATQLPSLGLSQCPSECSTPPLHSSFGPPAGDIEDPSGNV